MSCGRLFNTNPAKGRTKVTVAMAAIMKVVWNPQTLMPLISKGVPIIPAILAPNMEN